MPSVESGTVSAARDGSGVMLYVVKYIQHGFDTGCYGLCDDGPSS